jgi:solute carrier family 30 (zinc transporter), member 9
MGKNQDGSVKAVISAIVGNGVITVAKGVGWLFSGSPSMLAEAIHSIADTANQILLYVGITHGKKGPTREFPLGRGRARYVWNLISAIGIFFIGFGVTGYHGVHALMTSDSTAHSDVGLLSVGILIFALLVEGYVFLVALKVVNKERGELSLIQHFKQSDDPTTLGVLFEDGIAVLGVLFALAGIYLSKLLNSSLPDAIAAILIALLLGIMAIALAYINSRFLIGSAAPDADEKEIKKFLEEQDLVEKVVSLSTFVLGPGQLQIALEVEFHGEYFVDREQIARDVEKIRSGKEDAYPVLVDTTERTVRVMGNKINQLEKKLRQKFPSLTVIELEVN